MREEAPVPNTVIETENVNEMKWKEAAANQGENYHVSSRYFWFRESGFFLYFAVIKTALSVHPYSGN